MQALRIGPVDWLYSVYVIANDRAVKIGRARNVSGRLSSLQTGTPDHLSLAGTFDRLTLDEAKAVEKRAHDALSGKRIRGEWFDTDADEALTAIWRLIDQRVYVARFMATKDMRGHVSPETIEAIARKAQQDAHA